MKVPSPGFLLDAFSHACRRFPGTMLCAVVGVAALLVLIGDKSDEQVWAPVWMVCQLGLPLLTGIVAFSESKGWSEQRGWLLQLVGLAALAGYYFFIDIKAPAFEYVSLPKYFTLLAVSHLFVAVAPSLNSRSVRDFWEYNRELFANIIIGAVFTLILYTGLSLAILAVDQLFDLKIDFKIYGRLFVILAGIFNTSYFLYHFPANFEFADAQAGYNVVFKNLCKFILIPIVGLYFLILYTYGGKILATWNLPRGWVSSLVLGFSVAGIFTYLLNFYLPEHDDSIHVSGFRKWFWWVLSPLTVLLFVAIGKRIGDYGVTEMRFLVAHLGVWLAVTCLYFLISKHDNIKFIPVSLGLFGLAFAFGPLNAFNVAERSQVKILTGLLEKNGRWKDGHIIKGTSEIPKEEVDQIISSLRFLDRRGTLRGMAWLPMPLDSFPQNRHAYDAASQVAEWAGVSETGQNEKFNTLNVSGNVSYLSVDIRGYGTFFPLELYGKSSENPDEGYFFSISEDQKSLEWKQVNENKTSVVESFDVQPTLRDWLQRGPDGYLSLSQQDATFDLAGRKGTLRLTVRSADVQEKDNEVYLTHLSGYLFLKKK